MKYENEQSSFFEIDENKIKKIFANTKQTISVQRIHNMIVNNYKFEKAEDLHDILLIIMSSILDDDFRQYYEIKDKVVDKEFINDLIELIQTKISDSSVNYKHIIEALRKTPFANSFNICKLIYEQYKLNPSFISSLFQQFKKYNKYVGSNNEIWTPPIIAEFMCNILMKYHNKFTNRKQDNEITNRKQDNKQNNNNNKITNNTNINTFILLDPCAGFNNLIHPVINYCNQNDINLIVKGCEISSRAYFMGKIDLLNRGILNPQIIKGDFMKTNNDLLIATGSVNNPPYTLNIANNYDCLDFVKKSCDCCNEVVVDIFPKIRLLKNNKLNKDFLEGYKLLEVIELGDNIFKKVSTGNIVIVVASKLNDNNKDVKTKYYDLKEFSNEYKSIPHQDENVITDKGKQILSDYLNDKIEYVEYVPTANNMLPKLDILVNNIKSSLIEQSNKQIKLIESFVCVDYKITNEMIDNLKQSIKTLNDINDIIELLKFINSKYNINKDNYKLVNLMDYFELVKFKPIQIRYTNEDDTKAIYPLYSSSMYSSPSKLIDVYNIDTSEHVSRIDYNNSNNSQENINKDDRKDDRKDDNSNITYKDYLQINKNGSIGYCFIRNGKFSLTQDVYLLKPTKPINLNENINILTAQLTNMNFGFDNKINEKKLKSIEVYMLV